jgi:hypothetical protein
MCLVELHCISITMSLMYSMGDLQPRAGLQGGGMKARAGGAPTWHTPRWEEGHRPAGAGWVHTAGNSFPCYPLTSNTHANFKHAFTYTKPTLHHHPAEIAPGPGSQRAPGTGRL